MTLPHVIVLMGVAGCGKTTIGLELSRRAKVEFYDADDFHSDTNRAKMESGLPLTDDDRQPWLLRLATLISDTITAGGRIILACSALKASYRQFLVSKIASENRLRLKWVYLKGSKTLIGQRLLARSGHYFKPLLLNSQFDTLEEPLLNEAIVIDIDKPTTEIVSEIMIQLGA